LHKETRYEKFLQQHVDASMTVEKCDEEMKKKWIYNVDNSCKFTNTFILSNEKQVKDICKRQGSPYDTSLTKSKEKFNIVICQLNNGARKPNCQYNGRLHSNVRVVVQCKGGLPVHYAKHIETIESNNATTGKIPMDSTSVPTNIHV
uniref:Ribonuclease A-domain domain-containing protein n=1 Tax=Oreochromis niloticus TaxID=8128 RepID=I3KYV6_ORENI